MDPFILWAVGLLMIYCEFYLPGGVMGTLGALVVLGSIVVFAMQYPSPLWIILYIVVTIVSVVLLFRYALWHIRHAKPGSSIYSESDQEGYVASTYDTSAIGKVGIVETDLKPGGHILIDGKKLGAISLSGYITKGSEIIVIDGQGESLTVKHYKKEKEHE